MTLRDLVKMGRGLWDDAYVLYHRPVIRRLSTRWRIDGQDS